MVRIAPVRLAFNPKTLWFSAEGLELHAGDDVIVSTARGNEFGTVSNALFDMHEDDTKKLKSPLKPVKRLATEEDVAHQEELAQKSVEALPVFKRLAAESSLDMNPISVEYLFDGDKAVFYFEAEERVDFRDLVRKLASEFHVRVDMKQIGVRDGARMVGGLGHCGQELCCRRLGGEFNPVSIRMAKEQDLSLNPTKISGMCGRLMCCLRYEYDAYKDFHGRAPKKNAKIQTPDGEGKVVDMDVPRETISVKVGDEKPVKVPLADFEPAPEGGRPCCIEAEAWAVANEPAALAIDSAFGLFANQLTGEDQLAQPGKVHHVHADDEKPGRSRRRRGGSSSSSRSESSREREQREATPARKPRRRRSTTVTAEGEAQTSTQPVDQARSARDSAEAQSGQGKSSRRRSRGRGGTKPAKGADEAQSQGQGRSVQVGRKSSALRSARSGSDAPSAQDAQGASADVSQDTGARKQGQANRRRRRSHKPADKPASTE